MPKGQKQIDWTAENDARLILTILAVENVHPNCENVAAAFGGSVNAMAISNRLNRLRRKAAEEGLVPKGGAVASAKSRKGDGASTKGKEGMKGGLTAEGPEGGNTPFDHEESNSFPTRKAPAKSQKVLTGRIGKARNPAKRSNIKSNEMIADDVEAKIEDNGLDGDAKSEGNKGDDDEGEEIIAHVKSEEIE